MELVLPGTIKETRAIALIHFGVRKNAKDFVAKEGLCKNSELKKLPEWNG